MSNKQSRKSAAELQRMEISPDDKLYDKLRDHPHPYPVLDNPGITAAQVEEIIMLFLDKEPKYNFDDIDWPGTVRLQNSKLFKTLNTSLRVDIVSRLCAMGANSRNQSTLDYLLKLTHRDAEQIENLSAAHIQTAITLWPASRKMYMLLNNPFISIAQATNIVCAAIVSGDTYSMLDCLTDTRDSHLSTLALALSPIFCDYDLVIPDTVCNVVMYAFMQAIKDKQVMRLEYMRNQILSKTKASEEEISKTFRRIDKLMWGKK